MNNYPQQARLIGPINSGVAAGGAGVATANANSPLPIYGELLGLYIQYLDTPPAATTDVILKTVGTSPAPPTLTFLTRSNSATDGWFRPMQQGCDAAAAAIAGAYMPLLLADYINIKIDQANNGDGINVWLLVK